MENESLDKQDSGFFNKDFLNGKDLMNESFFSRFEDFYYSKESPFRLIKARKNGRVFILKTLKEEEKENELYRKILYKEFEIPYRLGDHPYIRKTLTWEYINPYGACIVMECVNGITLSDFLKKKSFSLTLDNVYRILDELCDVLAFLHSNQVIHCDLKPQNILLTRYGYHVKLIDFGYADREDYIAFKNLGGTKCYSAPEQSNPSVELDCRVDIYSLGFIILELNKTFANNNLQHIASRCLQKDRSKRYSTIYEILQELHDRRNLRTTVFFSVFSRWILAVFLFIGILLSSCTFYYWYKNTLLTAEMLQKIDCLISSSVVVNPLNSNKPKKEKKFYFKKEKFFMRRNSIPRNTSNKGFKN